MTHRIVVLVFCVLFTFPLFAQQNYTQTIATRNTWKQIQFQTSDQVSMVDFFVKNKIALGLENTHDMVLLNQFSTSAETKIYRFRQEYKQIPVFGSMYILHETSGKITSSNGDFLPHIDCSTIADWTPEQAKQIAIQSYESKESTASEEFSLDNILTNLQIIDQAFPKRSSQYTLAYQVDLHTEDQVPIHRYLISAKNGNPIFDYPLLEHQTVPGKGQSRYYGQVEFLVDSISENEFHLRDQTRGAGITTFIDTPANGPASDEDNNWDNFNDNDIYVAVDAHYCTTKFYDYLMETFGWSGLDGVGKSMNPIVYSKGNGEFVNAFWNGSFAYFGNGDCHYGPLTTLEVVAHEFTHGLTDYTSDLIYQGESGAINESMSDVFGKALEYFEDNENFKWEIGHSFLQDYYTESFRSMEDPKSVGLPQTYQGVYWNDNGGVHTNSAVGNHFFYRFVEGGSGVTEKGEDFDFVGVGMDVAMELIFRVQTEYLTPNSTYNDYYESCKIVGEEMFGSTSGEYFALTEAWRVVGFPYEDGGGEVTDLSLVVLDNVTKSCGVGVYVPFDVEITNTGTTAYPKDYEIELLFNSFPTTETYFVQFEENLNPGEAVLFTIDDYLQVEIDSNYYITARIVNPDDVSNNNSDFFYTQNKTISFGNLALQDIRFDFILCKGDNIKTTVRVYNQSCEEIPTGTDINVRLYDQDNNEILNSVKTINYNLISGGYFNFSEVIDFTGVEEIRAELSSSLDVFADDNQTEYFSVPKDRLISDEYVNNMDDNSMLTDFYLEEKNKNYYLDYNDQSYLWTTGELGSNNQDICSQLLENFNLPGYYGEINSFETCLDMSEFTAPFISFDLIQFRKENAIDQEEFQYYSAMMKVEYETESGEIFSEAILGQENGSLESYYFLLPPQSKGKLKLQFYNHTGNDGNIPFNSTLDNQLLDSLVIGEQVVNTEAIEQDKHLSLFPNPAQDRVLVQSRKPATIYQIYNLQGQVLQQSVFNQLQEEIDVRTFSDGLYTLQVQYEDGSRENIKFVVIH